MQVTLLPMIQMMYLHLAIVSCRVLLSGGWRQYQSEHAAEVLNHIVIDGNEMRVAAPTVNQRLNICQQVWVPGRPCFQKGAHASTAKFKQRRQHTAVCLRLEHVQNRFHAVQQA